MSHTDSGLMPTYLRLPTAFVRGEGAWLYDENGEAFLDALSGIAVCGLGHAHPAVAAAVQEQAGRLVHTSNLYRVPLQEQLAAKLLRCAGQERAFFCNSGAEANEAAFKLARLHGRRKNIRQPGIVVMEDSFHGRTLATLSASGNRKIQAGFEPLVSGFVRAPFGDAAAVQAIVERNADVVAVMLEPILGEGGIRVPPPGYLQELRTLCDRRELLLICDEVQTGNGRTGDYFASLGEGVQADILTTAKGLGNGVPIGACMARGAAAELFQPGNHASTFGGNPLACAAALAVLETIDKEGLCARAAQLGERLMGEFRARLAKLPQLVEVRGRGLMIGIELAEACGELVARALERHLLINVTAGRVVRLTPPLILGDEEAQTLLDTLCGLLEEM